MGETWILAEHPDLDGPAINVTLNSFVKLYEKKGWVAVEDPEIALAETPRESEARVFKAAKANTQKKTATKTFLETSSEKK